MKRRELMQWMAAAAPLCAFPRVATAAERMVSSGATTHRLLLGENKQLVGAVRRLQRQAQAGGGKPRNAG